MRRQVTTKSGRALSQDDVDRLTDRVEEGLVLSTWVPRRGRPSLEPSAGEHSPRIAVRVPASLHDRVMSRAAHEGRSMSEVVRDLLERYANRQGERLR